MPYPIATWDEAALGSPMHAGYDVLQPALAVRSELVNAQPIYRRTARSRPRVVDVTIAQTQAQFQAFETFFKTTLDGGQAWFTVALYGPGGSVQGVGHIESYEPETVGPNWQHSRTVMRMEFVG